MSEDLLRLSVRFSRAMAVQRAASFAGDAGGRDAAPQDRDRALIAASGFRAALAAADPAAIESPQERIAFWINLYNALVSLSIVELGLRGSLSLRADFQVRTLLETGGSRFSLDDIEEGILGGDRRGGGWPFRRFWRGDRRRELVVEEPDFRFRFALDGGMASSPAIAFCGELGPASIAADLAAAEAAFADAHFHVDHAGRRVTCSRLFLRLRRELPGRWLDDPGLAGYARRRERFDTAAAPPAGLTR